MDVYITGFAVAPALC